MATNNGINSNQTLSSGSSPTFAGLNLTGLSASSLVATDGSKNLVSGNLSGDGSTSNLTFTLATVNSNVGSFGSATAVPVITVNGKGLITAVITAATSGAITGSANQVLVNGTTGTPQTGAITLTLPQFLGTTSTPTFGAMTLSSAGSGLNLTNNTVVSGQTIAPLNWIGQDSGAAPAFYNRIRGDIVSNTAGAMTGVMSFLTQQAGTLTEYFNIDGSAQKINFLKSLSLTSGDVSIDTAGKTVKIKTGSNACAGTGATMVGGSVTVSTTAVSTSDFVLTVRTATGGTPGLSSPVVTISNGVSFTLTSSNILDTSTYSWVIIKAA